MIASVYFTTWLLESSDVAVLLLRSSTDDPVKVLSFLKSPSMIFLTSPIAPEAFLWEILASKLASTFPLTSLSWAVIWVKVEGS